MYFVSAAVRRQYTIFFKFMSTEIRVFVFFSFFAFPINFKMFVYLVFLFLFISFVFHFFSFFFFFFTEATFVHTFRLSINHYSSILTILFSNIIFIEFWFKMHCKISGILIVMSLICIALYCALYHQQQRQTFSSRKTNQQYWWHHLSLKGVVQIFV